VFEAVRGRVTVERTNERLRRWSGRLLAQADVRLEVVGRERIDWRETFVVMSNHRSLYDIPVLFQAVPGTLRMVAKAELFRVPIWGPAMRAAGFIEIHRKDRERAVASLRASGSVLDEGVNVWIAPEGTRSRSGDLGRFKLGGFMLAIETGHRILPVSLSGTEGILPADGALVRRGARVCAEFGEPVDPSSFGANGRDRLVEAVRASIEEMRLRASAPRDARAAVVTSAAATSAGSG
jgi:1-acyl-sn-glycerol-3-phosphate acyltransferase